MRHSSQGNLKYSKDINDLIARTQADYGFMPPPSFLRLEPRIQVHSYGAVSVSDFLSIGNCFWYLLPEGYTDQGPRVIMEAMAAGLPVIAENRDGAKDRVTPETGWLVDSHEEAVGIINSLTPEILEKKGKAARERARTEFNKERWIEEVLCESESLDMEKLAVV
jgi:glycosyltransferase involved in cell wall biosynthesis